MGSWAVLSLLLATSSHGRCLNGLATTAFLQLDQGLGEREAEVTLNGRRVACTTDEFLTKITWSSNSALL